MAETKMQTIADIAREAGVSKSTVSRALNDSPLIGAETKARIRDIATTHGFQMSASARRLSRGQSDVVALVVYAHSEDEQRVPDAFMLEIMGGISAALHENGYDLLVVHVTPRDTAWVARYFESGRVDGFILMSSRCTREHFEALAARNAPFVLWGAAPGGRPCCSVIGDGVAGGRLATEHLLNAGRKRIAFLGGPTLDPEVKQRYAGYVAALEAAGIEVDPSLVVETDYKTETATEQMRLLLAEHDDLDAVFAGSDLMAIAAIDEARAQGRSVPDEIAVVGYDDISLARHTDPPLTTIRQDGPVAGRLLAETLLQHLRTGALTSVTIPAELVVRRSA